MAGGSNGVSKSRLASAHGVCGTTLPGVTLLISFVASAQVAPVKECDITMLYKFAISMSSKMKFVS